MERLWKFDQWEEEKHLLSVFISFNNLDRNVRDNLFSRLSVVKGIKKKKQ